MEASRTKFQKAWGPNQPSIGLCNEWKREAKMEREGAGKKKIFFQSFNISKKEREGEKKKK